MDELKFSGQLTEKDFRTANSFAFKKVWVLVGICILFILVPDILNGRLSLSSKPKDIFFILLPIIVLIPGMLGMRYLALKRQWRNNKIIQLPIHGSVSEEGIKWEAEGVTSANITWDLLLRYRKSSRVILLYHGQRQALFFFPHFFENETQWNSFRELVEKKLARK